MKVSKDLFVGANIPHKTEVGNPNENPKYIRELLGSSYLGVKRLFVLAYNNVENNADKIIWIISKNTFFKE